MISVYCYKGLLLFVTNESVTVEYWYGFSKCYHFTPRMKSNTKQSVVRFLKRINAI